MSSKVISVFTLIFLPLFVEAIVGGNSVTDPHKYPWMVKVTAYFGLCGGSIISKNMVMTAAHCVRNKRGNVAKFAIISLGHSNLNSDKKIHKNCQVQLYVKFP